MPKGGRAVTTWRLEAVMRRDGTRCWLCGEYVKPKERTIDHAIPKGRGGTNHLHNLRLAHSSCNGERGMIAQTAPRAARIRLEKLRLPLPTLELTAEMMVGSREPLDAGSGICDNAINRIAPADHQGRAGASHFAPSAIPPAQPLQQAHTQMGAATRN